MFLADELTGEPIGFREDKPIPRLKLRSLESAPCRAFIRAYDAQRALDDAITRQSAQPQAVSEDSRLPYLRGLLAAATADWENICLDGEAIACTPANIDALYKVEWILTQGINFAKNLANFGGKGMVPITAAEEAEKKSESGQSGGTLSQTA